MARKRLSPIVQAMNLFGQLDERDKQTLADWIRSQTATPRKASTKKVKKEAPLLTGVGVITGTSTAGSNAA